LITFNIIINIITIRYQKSYHHLKEMKIEIEHIQHLLEKARFKLTKDFEFWILNNYSTDSQIFTTSNKCNYNNIFIFIYYLVDIL